MPKLGEGVSSAENGADVASSVDSGISIK